MNISAFIGDIGIEHSILNVLSMLLWDFPIRTSSEVGKVKWKNHDFQINFFQSFDQTRWKYGFKNHTYLFFNNFSTIVSHWFWILKLWIFHGTVGKNAWSIITVEKLKKKCTDFWFMDAIFCLSIPYITWKILFYWKYYI